MSKSLFRNNQDMVYWEWRGVGSMNNYPSDITREQFEIIRPILEGARKKTRPPDYDIDDIFCGILYLIKSGCQWRMIPSDFPKWGIVR